MNESKNRNVGVKRLTDEANDALCELRRLIVGDNDINGEEILKDGKLIEIALKRFVKDLRNKEANK